MGFIVCFSFPCCIHEGHTDIFQTEKVFSFFLQEILSFAANAMAVSELYSITMY